MILASSNSAVGRMKIFKRVYHPIRDLRLLTCLVKCVTNVTNKLKQKCLLNRAVARSENPGGLVVLGGDNVPPLVKIGLTDLPKTGRGAYAPPAPPFETCLHQLAFN